MSIISWLCSFVWQWILGSFGMSDAQKLGRQEIQNADLKATLAEVRAEDAAAQNVPHGKEEILKALRHGEL